MPRKYNKFTKADGYQPADLIHCSMDHMSAAESLFESNPSFYDSAGYLAHIGVELLLKGWLLEVNGYFKDKHNLHDLYNELMTAGVAAKLDAESQETLFLLDRYEKLRYPDIKAPTEVGLDDWPAISKLVGEICRVLPETIVNALEKINANPNEPIRKAGRVLMEKKKQENT